jgi:P-type Ca2+ transporter type 2C
VQTSPGSIPKTTDRNGLSSAEAARRLSRDGGNTLPAQRPTPAWRRIVAQLRDPLVMVLLVAAALTIATGDWTDATVIIAVITINTAVGVAQEVKADREITALRTIAAPHARVLRDGIQCRIPAAEIVVGDLIVLGEGDIVPADADIVESAALRVDESAVTGESVPVDKYADPGIGAGDTALVSGTVVVHGRGLAVVTATGEDSAMGRIAASMATGGGLTPLQHRLVGVGRALAIAAVVLSTVVFTIGLVRGQSVELMLVTTISLVVAAVPESLPAVVTLALALGARRMAARHALIRRLPAVETLGSVTVLATDKTGTLTEGRMVVRRLWTPLGSATVDGDNDRPDGQIRRDGRRITADSAPDLADLLTDGALCNDATLRGDGDGGTGRWEALGDPTETALLIAAGKLGVLADTTHWQRTGEEPFDSHRKRMSTAHRRPDGTTRIVCKGAPEAVLTSDVLRDGVDGIGPALTEAARLADAGYRVLAVADLDQPHTPPTIALERCLRLVGLIAIADPPRASAAATIAAGRAAGITPILITGDHPATAHAIAVDTGVIEADATVVDCRTVSGAHPDAWTAGRVFARATPQQKLDIIQARRDAGDIVAMTGDGVNDGPALRRADIGVAMGQRGTEVARQAADLVLADDDLGTVVAAAEEGRRVYANIRRFLLYALAGGTAEIVVMLTGPFVGLPLTLLPAQLLWINLLTHGLPGVALGSEPVEPGTMTRPPRPPAESVLGAGLWQRILRIAFVISAVTLGVAVWAAQTGRPWQSLAFFTLGATQLAVAIGSRARPGTRSNPMLLVAVVSALGLQIAGLYLPVLRTFLHTEPVAAADLAIAAALACLGYVAIRLDRVVHHATTDARPIRAESRPAHDGSDRQDRVGTSGSGTTEREIDHEPSR